MKPVFRTVMMAGTIALAAALACAGSGGARAEEAFAPYSEDYTRGEPIPPETLSRIVHAKALLHPQRTPNPPRRKRETPSAAPLPAAQRIPPLRTGM